MNSGPHTQSSHYFVIFGAAVRSDGTLSGSLKRRVEGAIALAGDNDSAKFIATGAVGKYGPAEADVMRELLLRVGIQDHQIICEREGSDTLSSVINCKGILQDIMNDVIQVTVCSSRYHNPRCAWLFWLLGIKASWGIMPDDRPYLTWRKLLFFQIREPPAIIWDTLVLLFYKLTGRINSIRRQSQISRIDD